jgi:GT2 family glycosyltransferase
MTAPVSPPLVTVTIINFNGEPFLNELLQSLAAQTYRRFEILFIDNASTDDSVSFVRSNYPAIQLMVQSENLGFARAGNLGLQASAAEFTALLNADLRLEPDWLERLVEAARKDPSIAAVACKLLFYDRPGCLNGVGGTMNQLGYTWDIGMNEEDQGQFDEPSEVLFASAGATLFRRAAFLEAGGFDEKFFMYHEDVDLCWRLWLLGFRIVTEPTAVAYHHFGGVTKSSKGMRWRELLGERNSMRSLLKNYESANAVRAITRMLLLSQPTNRKLAQLKNLAWNLLYLGNTFRERRKVQSRRIRGDDDLEHLIVKSNHVPVRL